MELKILAVLSLVFAICHLKKLINARNNALTRLFITFDIFSFLLLDVGAFQRSFGLKSCPIEDICHDLSGTEREKSDICINADILYECFFLDYVYLKNLIKLFNLNLNASSFSAENEIIMLAVI